MDESFIHLATKEQVPHVAEKFWKGLDHAILKIDSKKLVGRLIFETNPGGTNKYFHLYKGSIPADAIVEVTFASDGSGEKLMSNTLEKTLLKPQNAL